MAPLSIFRIHREGANLRFRASRPNTLHKRVKCCVISEITSSKMVENSNFHHLHCSRTGSNGMNYAPKITFY